MYMVRGNRGGAETDGRAEDPFEAAACGASASALQLLLLPLAPIENLRTMLAGPKKLRAFPWRHSGRPSNPFARENHAADRQSTSVASVDEICFRYNDKPPAARLNRPTRDSFRPDARADLSNTRVVRRPEGSLQVGRLVMRM